MESILVLIAIFGFFAHGSVAFLPHFPDKLAQSVQVDPKWTGKIVGGVPAVKDEYPFQVSLQRLSTSGKLSHFCGATFIASDKVVTAAHCVSGKSESKLYVYYGNIHLEKDLKPESPFVSSIKKIVSHEKYDSGTVENDIALIKLNKKVAFGPSAGSIKLPEKFHEVPIGHSVIVTGWGTTSEGGSIPTQLHKVSVPVVSTSACQTMYEDEKILESMLCAGLPEGGKDSCQGDSGGPLFDDKKVLLGIVSWGYGCARPDLPGVYTKVSHFTTWVDTISKKLDQEL